MRGSEFRGQHQVRSLTGHITSRVTESQLGNDQLMSSPCLPQSAAARRRSPRGRASEHDSHHISVITVRLHLGVPSAGQLAGRARGHPGSRRSCRQWHAGVPFHVGSGRRVDGRPIIGGVSGPSATGARPTTDLMQVSGGTAPLFLCKRRHMSTIRAVRRGNVAQCDSRGG